MSKLNLANRLIKTERVRKEILAYGRNKDLKDVLNALVQAARDTMTQESWDTYRSMKQIAKMIKD
jgi:hypothetical protein